jgi:homoserine acetyltransferase
MIPGTRLVQRALQSSCDRRKGASSQARDDAWCAGFYGNKSHWGAMLATARRHSTIGYLSAVEFERKAGLA